MSQVPPCTWDRWAKECALIQISFALSICLPPRWWQAGSSGLFSFLGLQGSCIHVTRTEHTPPPGSLVQLEWTSASAVLLSCNKQTLGFYSPR